MDKGKKNKLFCTSDGTSHHCFGHWTVYCMLNANRCSFSLQFCSLFNCPHFHRSLLEQFLASFGQASYASTSGTQTTPQPQINQKSRRCPSLKTPSMSIISQNYPSHSIPARVLLPHSRFHHTTPSHQICRPCRTNPRRGSHRRNGVGLWRRI